MDGRCSRQAVAHLSGTFEAGEEAAEQFSGVALAKKYFECLGYETLDGLGVQIIEGDHPGSNYYAAVLRQDVDYVNQVARDLGLTFRFREA